MLDPRTAIRIRRRLGLPAKQPPGWRPGPPDFVGVGTQRSGTTWWFRQILRHPAVVAPWGKERHFFDRYGSREFTDQDRLGYERLFPRPPDSLTGEWTPRYMYDPWAPPLLRQSAPEARILVLLRDPWRRLISGIAHEERVLSRELRRPNGEYLSLMIRHDALRRSLYASQVERVLDRFDRAQVLILQYEKCVAEPERELNRTFAHLGLEMEEVEIERRAPTAAAPSGMPIDVEADLRSRLASDVSRLVELAPEIDPELWPTSR